MGWMMNNSVVVFRSAALNPSKHTIRPERTVCEEEESHFCGKGEKGDKAGI
jgi:hypothetical protein